MPTEKIQNGLGPSLIRSARSAVACIDVDLKEVIRGTAVSFILKVVGMVAAFAVSVVITRSLPKSDAGLYFLAISIITILSTVGRLGFENTVVRFVASGASDLRWAAVEYVYRASMWFVAAGAAAISFLLFLGAGFIADHIFNKSDATAILRVAACAIIPTALLMIQGDALRGLKWIISSQLIKRVSLPLLTLMLLYPMVRIAGVGGAVWAYFIAGVLTVICSHMWWKRAMTGQEESGSKQTDSIHFRQLVAVSVPLFGVMVCGLALRQFGTVLVGVWADAASVSDFSIAQRTANLLLFPLLSVITILAPKFAAMVRHRQDAQLKLLTKRSMLLIVGTGTPLCIALYWFAGDVVRVFGPSYVMAADVLRILVVGIFFNMISGPAGTLLMMAGRERDCLLAGVLSVAVFSVLSVAMIPTMEAQGAAFATTAALIVQSATLFSYVRWRMGFWLMPSLR